ncbi:fimbrial protein [Serratia fonticola]|uniref:fimbrial protein n=1 Tax=Serratia fonticola TaxID=47917 RepID=UPI00217A2B44|nr:fimbrial protein [Serratia fonticola]CAI1771657.1 Type-1A pilin [Serratia fonticola]
MLNKKFVNYLKISIFLIAVLLGQQAVAATCTSTSGGNWTPSGSLTYQRDQAIGTWGSNKFGTSSAYQFSCTGDTSADRDAYLTLTVASAPVAGYTDVYPTNISGVGVRYNFAINSGSSSFCPVQFDDHIINSARTYTCHIIHNTSPGMSFGASIEFVKIGNSISSGTITTMPRVTVSYSLNGQSGTWNLPVMWSGSANVNLTAVACSINTANITVPLDDVLPATFTSISTTAKPKAFNVGLNCNAGARVNMRMTGTQNRDTSASGVLDLTGAGNADVATGVGIQILYNGTPVTLDNNMVLKTSTGGQENFPFTAQYYQTRSTVTAGSANSTATLNLTCQ